MKHKRNSLIRLVILVGIILSVCITETAYPYTTSGTLAEDESWSGEIVITGDVTVPKDITLTISPGTTVKFTALEDDGASGSDTSRCELRVYGNLLCNGTSENPILLTSTASIPNKQDWTGILVYASYGSQVQLEYTTIEYTQNGLV